MDETNELKEIEKGIFSDPPSQSEFPWKNLSIGIGVVVVVIFLVYIFASSSIKSANYKPMDLSAKNQDGTVAGASVQSPVGPQKPPTVPTKAVVSPTSAAPTTAPTATPTPQPGATATPTPAPTATPTPADTPTPTLTPTLTPTETPVPSQEP